MSKSFDLSRLEGASEREQVRYLVEGILARSHPEVARGLLLASIPSTFDLPLMSALRSSDDGRDQHMLARLEELPFVERLAGGREDRPKYAVQRLERDLLQRHFIRERQSEYLDAQWSALHYWREARDEEPAIRSQNILAHWLIIESKAADAANLDSVAYLTELFRLFVSERRLAAVQRLISRARESVPYLEALESPWTGQLADLLALLEARLDQYRGRWPSSRNRIEVLRKQYESGELWPSLTPYFQRAFGGQLAQEGDYVGAVEMYRLALEHFEANLGNSLSRVAGADRGMTMIDMGDTLLELARSVRGPRDDLPPAPGFGQRLREAVEAFIALPALFYLAWSFGLRVFRPEFWLVIRDEDWIIIRLFVQARRWYKRADRLLERSADALLVDGVGKDGLRFSSIQLQKVLADERLAFLYLDLGDAQQARQEFEGLLEGRQAQLSQYRRATNRVGLAAAYLLLGRCAEARALLRKALPMLISYQDETLEARARKLLAEASLAQGDIASAAEQFAAASASFRKLADWTAATEIAERLEDLSDQHVLNSADFPALAPALDLAQRQYGGRFRHPYLTAFRRLALVALPVLLLLIPLLTTSLSTETTLTPEIHFRAAPLLNSEQRVSTELSQGVTAANAAVSAAAEVVLRWVLWAAIGYAGGSFLVGLVTLLVTPLRTVQERGRAATITLSGESLTLGQRTLPWTAATGLIQANVSIWGRRLVDESYFAVLGRRRAMEIRGSTDWYPKVAGRIERRLSPGTLRENFSVDLLRGKVGLLYLANLALLAIALLLIESAPGFIWRDWPGLRYSLGEIFPFLYPGLFVLPLWWLLISPLRARYRIKPGTRRPWILLAGAALLCVYLVVSSFRPLLTPVNLFIPVAIIILACAAAAAIWRARRNGDHQYPLAIRGPVIAVAALLTLFMLGFSREQVGGYHHWTLGNYHRDRALAGHVEELVPAEDHYRRAEIHARRGSLGIDVRRAVDWPIGVPEPDGFTWLVAAWSRAALLVQLERYDEAIASYDALLRYTSYPDRAFAGRALAYQSAVTTVLGDDRFEAFSGSGRDIEGTAVGAGMEIDPVAYQSALFDFDRALRVSPEPRYYLWRGVAQHSLGNLDRALDSYEKALSGVAASSSDASPSTELMPSAETRPSTETRLSTELSEDERVQALLGVGWIRYQGEQFELARRSFEEATVILPDASEAWLALGYALYAQEDYYRALLTWQQGLSMEPGEPTILASLGTLFWKFGNIQCLAYQEAANYLTRSISQGVIRGFSNEEVAFTYRTRAQIKYLLANRCTPEEDNEALIAAYEDAAGDYTRALVFEPSNAFYVHMRGRLHYATWTISDRSGPAARLFLVDALADLDRALAINPTDEGGYQPNRYRGFVLNTLTDGANSNLIRGSSNFEAGNYVWSYGYYKMVADAGIPDRPAEVASAAFGAGLSALALSGQTAGQDRATLDEIAGDLGREAGLEVSPDALGDLLEKEAARLYSLGIGRAIAQVNEDAVRDAWHDLEAEAGRLGFDIPAPVETLFNESGVELEDARALFSQALEAAQSGDSDAAQELYDRAISKAATEGDPGLVRSHLLFLIEEGDKVVKGQFLAQLAESLPQLAGVIGDEDLDGALELALLSVAAGDPNMAGAWLNESARLAALSGDLPAIREAMLVQLPLIWRSVRPPAAALLDGMDAELPFLLARDDGLPANGVFWRFRAWLKYYLGLSAFRLGAENVARRALALAEPDANRAALLEEAGGDSVHTYLPEAAWGWYHLERGDDRYAEGDLPGALDNYRAAADFIRPLFNETARSEAAIASFRAGRTALELGQSETALAWIGEGIERAAATADPAAALNAAHDQLELLLASRPDLAEEAAPLLELIETAAGP